MTRSTQPRLEADRQSNHQPHLLGAETRFVVATLNHLRLRCLVLLIYPEDLRDVSDS